MTYNANTVSRGFTTTLTSNTALDSSITDNVIIANINADTSDSHANNSIFLHCDGVHQLTPSLLDSSPNLNNWLFGGNARYSTDQVKFGISSVYFDGNAYLYGSPTYIWPGLGYGSYTFEMWIYPTVVDSNRRYLFNFNGDVDNANLPIVSMQNGAITWLRNTSETTFLTSANNVITANNWHHIAICRQSQYSGVFVNGALVTGRPYDAAFIGGTTAGAGKPYIGQISPGASSSSSFIGYMDEIRFSTVGRYTGAYTIPTAPFVGNTPCLYLPSATRNIASYKITNNNATALIIKPSVPGQTIESAASYSLANAATKTIYSDISNWKVL